MIPIAYFGIHSSTLSLLVDLLILFLAIVYLSLIYWTYSDARRRVADPLLVGCATLAALFPFVGPLVYAILRPPEYLEDARERELETRAAELRLAQLQASMCPHCDYPIERDFIRCPSCLQPVKDRCAGCAKPLDPAWTICPYCETEVVGAGSAAGSAPSRARRRRSRVPEAQPPAQAATRVERAARRGGADAPARGRELADADADVPARARDLLGSTVEADELILSEDGEVAPVPTSAREAARAERRSRRTRPQGP